MKKLLLLILSIVSISAFGQSFANPQKAKPAIISDAVNSDGERIIRGASRCANEDTSSDVKKGNTIGSIWPYVFAVQLGDYTEIFLGLEMNKAQPIEIKKGSPVLLKTAYGDVIDLTISRGHSDQVGRVTSTLSLVHSIYTIYPSIKLTQELVEYLRSEGIAKLRFELNGDICDFTLKKDNISQFIYDEFLLITEALTSKRSFSDDF